MFSSCYASSSVFIEKELYTVLMKIINDNPYATVLVALCIFNIGLNIFFFHN